MNLKRDLKTVLVAIAALILLILPVSTALAVSNQSNQDMNQPAMLIAPEPDFKIKVQPKPDNEKSPIGYGMGGDSVTVIQQVGSNEGYTWNYVRFDAPPNLKGWIREDFLSFQDRRSQSASGSSPQKTSSNQENQNSYQQKVPSYQDKQQQNTYNATQH